MITFITMARINMLIVILHKFIEKILVRLILQWRIRSHHAQTINLLNCTGHQFGGNRHNRTQTILDFTSYNSQTTRFESEIDTNENRNEICESYDARNPRTQRNFKKLKYKGITRELQSFLLNKTQRFGPQSKRAKT
ncbi:hypothetical protein V8G54_004170 [Vigna mungo]|uniref:Uncharacterized protein n=1 Tax=Vigna mungo TaxID=3915 RepID=A0AAQ3PD13_VIGMU